MKTKIVHLPLLLLTALAAVSFARADEPPAGPPPGPPGEHGGRPRLEHRLQQLDETLQLTASQKEQIKAIWAQAAEQGKALRADDAAAREARRTKGMEVLKATRAKVRAVLTLVMVDEQQQGGIWGIIQLGQAVVWDMRQFLHYYRLVLLVEKEMMDLVKRVEDLLN